MGCFTENPTVTLQFGGTRASFSFGVLETSVWGQRKIDLKRRLSPCLSTDHLVSNISSLCFFMGEPKAAQLFGGPLGRSHAFSFGPQCFSQGFGFGFWVPPKVHWSPSLWLPSTTKKGHRPKEGDTQVIRSLPPRMAHGNFTLPHA